MMRVLLLTGLMATSIACDVAPNPIGIAASAQGGADAGGGEGGTELGGRGGAGGHGGHGGEGGAGVPPCADPGVLAIQLSPPATLSETGLFEDTAGDVIADHVRTFTPRYPLWSDGSTKRRFIYLPPACVVDTTDMDNWQFPVGMRVWKEFSVGAQRIETRLIHRYGEGPSDYWYAAYLWDAGMTEAHHVPEGVADALGTDHDVPNATQCVQCHAGSPAVLLGFEAFQLSHALGGETMASLSAAGTLSTPAPAGFAVPGNANEQAALGYMHGNCSGCHNPSQVPLLPLSFKLLTRHTAVADTALYQDCVGQPTLATYGPTLQQCVVPGAPSESVLRHRMAERMENVQMPPFATEQPDVAAIAAIDVWITALP